MCENCDDPEGHFKIIIVASRFTSKTTIARYRLIRRVLKEELKDCDDGDCYMNTLSVVARTKVQWYEEHHGLIDPDGDYTERYQ